jgi:chorismate dehydratase
MIKVGSIAYINSLPVDLGIASGAVPCECEMMVGVPAELNAAVFCGELDMSPVSALYYAEHSSELVLLPDLSISSESGVKSVLLFTKVPIAQLGGKKIFASVEGKTTPALLQILLTRKYNVAAQIVPMEFDWQSMESAKDADAFLLIGDDALLAVDKPKAGYKVIDLAEEWREWTKMPFVFAVWVARKEFYEEHKLEVLEVVAALKESREWAKDNQEELLDVAQEKTGLSKSALESYFSRLRYDLTDELRQGLNKFIQLAMEEKLIAGRETPIPKVSERLQSAKSGGKSWHDKLGM